METLTWMGLSLRIFSSSSANEREANGARPNKASASKNTETFSQKSGIIPFINVFERSLFCSTRLQLLDQKCIKNY